jgi:hypothetical protein
MTYVFIKTCNVKLMKTRRIQLCRKPQFIRRKKVFFFLDFHKILALYKTHSTNRGMLLLQ